MINVTKPFFPELEEYHSYLKEIWESGWLTNNGQMVQKLEAKLQELLGVKHVILVSNGTIALQIAIKALKLSGEIITTPFSYVATTSSIIWEGADPVFADINPQTLCIDPEEVAGKVTDKTSAILATHVYGIPCDVEALRQIAEKHQVKLIYDAAHAFQVNHKGTSLLNFGDVSTLSFHATKLFHTVEGGAIVTDDDDIAHTCEYMRRFGHKGPYDFQGLGINGKLSELHAAMGLCMLRHMPAILKGRRLVSEQYDECLDFKKLRKPVLEPGDTDYNYAYYPVICESEKSLMKVVHALQAQEIFPRRYFYPSLNELKYLERRQPCPVSEDLSRRVLALPLHDQLPAEDIHRIAAIVNENLQ